jgi:hypothetical protein
VAEESPFASFVPSTEVTAPASSAPKAKKPRKKKAAAPAVDSPLKAARKRYESQPEPVAKTRTAKAPRKARTIKIDLSLAMTALAGLQEADAKFVMGVVQAMQPFAKKQRGRIVAALAKFFA